MGAASHVCIVDDDDSVRESLASVFASERIPSRAFPSAHALLASDALVGCACLVLDVQMPGMTGLELLRELRARKVTTPVILISASHDESAKKQGLRDGAVDFLFKPFDDEALLRHVHALLAAASP